MQPIADPVAGNRLLSQYLHDVKIDIEGSTDLFYQINRRRCSTSDVPDLFVNRLSKWSLSTTGLLSLGGAPEEITIQARQFACRLELDINTVAEFPEELPHSRLSDLFDEFVRLSNEIAQEGDIP
jgi:hypothetical protein